MIINMTGGMTAELEREIDRFKAIALASAACELEELAAQSYGRAAREAEIDADDAWSAAERAWTRAVLGDSLPEDVRPSDLCDEGCMFDTSPLAGFELEAFCLQPTMISRGVR